MVVIDGGELDTVRVAYMRALSSVSSCRNMGVSEWQSFADLADCIFDMILKCLDFTILEISFS